MTSKPIFRQITRLSGGVALSAALAASVTLAAPRDAHAVVSAHTGAGTVLTFQAPFSDQFETGANQLNLLTVTRDGAAGTADNMILAALFYNGTTFVNFA